MNTLRKVSTRGMGIALAAMACTGAAACSSNTPAPATDAGPAGGPVDGPADMHCNSGPDGGLQTQTVANTSCSVLDAGLPPDTDSGPPEPEYGATMYGTSGNDDDCKYHVSWTSTPIRENQPVTFTATVSSLTLNAPVTPAGVPPGTIPTTEAPVLLEVFLSATHPAPNSNQMTTTTTPGVYTIGPILFDAPGMWTIRYHIHEACADVLDDSPHGHAAFYINVP